MSRPFAPAIEVTGHRRTYSNVRGTFRRTKVQNIGVTGIDLAIKPGEFPSGLPIGSSPAIRASKLPDHGGPINALFKQNSISGRGPLSPWSAQAAAYSP